MTRSRMMRGGFLLLVAVLGLAAGSVSLSASPVGCFTVPRPEFAKGGSIAVVSPVQDDDTTSSGLMTSLVEQDFRNAGFRVAEDPEDAELVVVVTVGRMGGSRNSAPRSSLDGLADFRSGAPGMMALRMGETGSLSDSGMVRAGLLLTAFRSADWDSLSETGALPSAVWRVFASGEYADGDLSAAPRELAACAVASAAQAAGRSVFRKSRP